MNILFIHQNFPAQFKGLAPVLAENPDNRVVAISHREKLNFKGIKHYSYYIKNPANFKPHPYLKEEQAKILRAEGVLNTAKKLIEKGFYPDVIYVHPGWGEGLFLKEIWPNAFIIGYYEYYYRLEGQDLGFNPEFPISDKQKFLLRLKNNPNLQALEAFDAGISPTKWQYSTYPKWAHNKISIIHEGIDTNICIPNREKSVTLGKSKLRLSHDDLVITYVSRYLEPLRGFYQFMRVLPDLLDKYPKLHILIVGNSERGYGAQLPKGETHKKLMLEELGDKLDPSRIHFLGRIPYSAYIQVLQISTVHYYATYPFVASWSLLEAMSCGCAVAASDVDPVKEFIQDNHNGLLFDFFDQKKMIKQISKLLDNKKLRNRLGKQARNTIQKNYNLEQSIQQHLNLLETVTKKKKR